MQEHSSRPVRQRPLLGFSGNEIDRAANHRRDPAWVAAQRASPKAAVIEIAGDKVATAGPHVQTRSPRESEELVFLGLDHDDRPYFAARAANAEESWRDLRSLAIEGTVPPAELGLLAQARSLINWHMTHGFCANCGVATRMMDGGYRRHCESCGTDHFPRTDPVIIIVVRSARGLLLGRQKIWAPGMYSALAGFMEPGETIENAARREVFEESAIHVGDIHYVMSQPWPFPSSLMIGLIGEAEDDAITVDPVELETARWFGRDELLLMHEERHPDGFKFPTRMAIAHHLILEALQLP
ncbi:MAG: NAD(+) diphosphatase [Rhizobiales bacterium]|nr:NAD(+) diphosphatase [Hyphomicrobiales bacterium]